MKNIKKGGILYSKNKVPKFSTGNAFSAEDFQFGDANLFKNTAQNSFNSPTANAFAASAAKTGYGEIASAPKFGKGFNANPVKTEIAQLPTSIVKAPVKPVGYNFGSTDKFRLTTDLNPALAATPTPLKPTFDMNKVSSAAGAIAPIVGAAGAALSQKGDGDVATFTGKEKANTVLGSTMSMAATGASLGSVIPGVGTLIGGAAGTVVGTVVGFLKSKKAKKEAKIEKQYQTNAVAARMSETHRANATRRDAELASSAATTGATQQATLSGYLSRKNGGSFHYTLKESVSPDRLVVYKSNPSPPKKLKRGGSIKATENIIPNGVLHEEFNDLGDKGMPVVKCKNNSCEKKYEIERDEMIFTLATTKNVEKLVKEGDLKKLGEFVKAQVLDNTHSFTDKFNELNNYKNKDESIYA